MFHEGACKWNEEVVVVEGTFVVTVCTCETEDSGRTSADEAAPVDEDCGIVGRFDEGSHEEGHGADEEWLQ